MEKKLGSDPAGTGLESQAILLDIVMPEMDGPGAAGDPL